MSAQVPMIAKANSPGNKGRKGDNSANPRLPTRYPVSRTQSVTASTRTVRKNTAKTSATTTPPMISQGTR